MFLIQVKFGCLDRKIKITKKPKMTKEKVEI